MFAANRDAERTQRLYERFARFYDAFRAIWSRWTRPVERALDGLFMERIGPDTRILELAPGTGINIERLLLLSSAFRSYLGIDASAGMLARARAKAGGDERIDLRVGDATDLAAVDGPFDFIVSTWLLSHLDAPAETVRVALGKLASGGTAVFVFLTAPRLFPLRYLLRRLGGPFHYRFVDPSPIGELPDLEQISVHAGGMATVVVFRSSESN